MELSGRDQFKMLSQHSEETEKKIRGTPQLW
jgi:hypothetical protein